MSDAPVHARVAAVKAIDNGVTAYGRALAGTLASARVDLNRASVEFQLAMVDSARALRDAERRTANARAALSRCRENCEPLQRAVAQAQVAEDRARQRHERNGRAQAGFQRAASEVLTSIRAAQTTVEQAVPAARDRIREYAEILQHYLATGAGS